jgi:hypothetical protein
VNHVAVALGSAGYHAPLYIALPVIGVVVIGRVAYSLARGRPAVVGKVVVRCGRGHVFTTTWSPLGSFTSIRLAGAARFQYCPIGHHWALVRPMNDSSPAGEDRRLPDGD